jgi:hypothetical protein
VDHALFVGVLQPDGRLPGVLAPQRHRQGALAVEDLLQAGSVDVFHDDEIKRSLLAEVVDVDHVEVVERGGRSGFQTKALQ